jgi:hypothetical protein
MGRAREAAEAARGPGTAREAERSSSGARRELGA